MNVKAQTIDTYNRSAEALAKKFDAIGARASDIERTFALCSQQDPFVVEIGCGNGRDAEEICKRTERYIGIDISENLIALAKQRIPTATFINADIESYPLPEGIDIVFAFASLIHVPKESFKTILEKMYHAMNPQGVALISLKHADSYAKVTKEDEFGVRTYWHYSEGDIRELASSFEIVEVNIQDAVGQRWIDVTLRKPNS